jgi:hypothetical protein
MNRWAQLSKPSLRYVSSSTGRVRSASALASRVTKPRFLFRALVTIRPPLSQQEKQQELRALHTFHTPDEKPPSVATPGVEPPFKKLLAANRGEISTRINRAAAELGICTAGIYSHEGMW